MGSTDFSKRIWNFSSNKRPQLDKLPSSVVIADFIRSGDTIIQIENQRLVHREKRLSSLANALSVRVDVKGLAAKKADQRLVALPSEFDSQARRGRDGSNERDARSKRFLHDFE